MTNKDTT